MTFDEFYTKVKELFENNESTNGDNSEAMLDYTKLGIQRIKRGLKTTSVDESIADKLMNTKSTNWLLITEGWCGDGANSAPVFARLAEANPNINLKVLLRDENKELMQNYLTNGGMAIPILILLDDDFNEIGVWGPRPAPAQEMVMENKVNPTMPPEEFKVELQKWYINDKTKTTQEELAELL